MDTSRATLRALRTPQPCCAGIIRRAPAVAAAAALCLLLLVAAALQAPTPAHAACDAASGCVPVVSQTTCVNSPSAYVVSNQPCSSPPVVVVCPGGAPVAVGGNPVCPALPTQQVCGTASPYVTANTPPTCLTPPTADGSSSGAPLVIYRPAGGTVPGSTICLQPGDIIVSQAGQAGSVTCGASTAAATATTGGFAKSAACDGGEAFSSATSNGSAATAACITAAGGVAVQETGAAATIAVVPDSIGAPGQQSSGFTIAHGTGTDQSGSAFTAPGVCLTSGGAAISVANSAGLTSGSCISINGTLLTPNNYPTTLMGALTAANISQALYNTLVPPCLRGVVNAIYLVAIGTYTFVPFAQLSSNHIGYVCS